MDEFEIKSELPKRGKMKQDPPRSKIKGLIIFWTLFVIALMIVVILKFYLLITTFLK